ncbi:MAG: flagellar biosynthetic protein FliO [Oscillospiraceae bacterium]|nr:flagellar biosynthetic protein FliO [Oscillospiraceae bacterium]
MRFLMLSASMESFLQLMVTLLIFVFVLFATYLTTRFIGNYQRGHMNSKNLRIIETIPAGQNKNICLLKAGTEYLVVAIGKDEIHALATLTEEQLTDLSFLNEIPNTMVTGESFQEIFGQLKDKMSKK